MNKKALFATTAALAAGIGVIAAFYRPNKTLEGVPTPDTQTTELAPLEVGQDKGFLDDIARVIRESAEPQKAPSPPAVVIQEKTQTFTTAPIGAQLAVEANRIAQKRGRLTEREVRTLANYVVKTYYPSVNPLMLMAMAKIESSFITTTSRYESHVTAWTADKKADTSLGIMQTLTVIARDMYTKGAASYGNPARHTGVLPPLNHLLYNPLASMYFGAAYVDWLRRHPRVGNSERAIVESYNAGPGNSNTQSQNHYAKYNAAKAVLTA